jgi:hypothetical protein
VLVQDRCTVCVKCIIMVLLGDEDQVEARFGLFGDSLVLMQDRCTVYAGHTIVSKIISDAPDGAPR